MTNYNKVYLNTKSELDELAEKIRGFFAIPHDFGIAASIIARKNRRRDTCLALARHLEQPDGRLCLIGIKLGNIARALNIKYKHARQALRDLIEIGSSERQKNVLFGNGCGHNPESPRYFSPPKKHKDRPKIIRKMIERIRRYYTDPSVFPALNAINGSITKKGKCRRQRSERREACVSLLCSILHFTDILTLRVGTPQIDGSMKGVTMPYLAKLSGLEESRADRAIKDLKEAGLVSVYSVCEKLEGALYKGHAAIRVVPENLFVMLGFSDWIRYERDKASAKQAKKDEKRKAKKAAETLLAINAQRGTNYAKVEEQIEKNKRLGMSTPLAHLAASRQNLKKGNGPPE